MQKLITKLTVISCFMFAAFNAAAIENNYKPYVGADYAYSAVSASPHYNSGRIFLGSVYNPYFGTELFYQYSDKDKINDGKIRNTSFNAYGLDLMTYLPLFNSGFAPLATAGIGQYNIKHKFVGNGNNNDHGWGFRIGGGLQYDLNDNWAIRAIARYVKTNKIDTYKHLSEYTVGLRYTFR